MTASPAQEPARSTDQAVEGSTADAERILCNHCRRSRAAMAFAAWACALPTAITDDSSLDGATAACRASNGQSSPGFWPSGAQHLRIAASSSVGVHHSHCESADQRERKPWPAASIHRRRSRNGGSYQLSFVSPMEIKAVRSAATTQAAAWIHAAGAQPCSARHGLARTLMPEASQGWAFLQPAWPSGPQCWIDA